MAVQSNVELQKLVDALCDAPEIRVRLEDMMRTMQQHIANKVFPFRAKVWDMARTLCEALMHLRSDTEHLVKECDDYLDTVVKKIANEFQDHHEFLNTASQDYHLAVLDHVEAGRSASRAATVRSNWSAFLWSCGGFALTTLYLGIAKPECLLTTGFAAWHTLLEKRETRRERMPSDDQDANRICEVLYEFVNGLDRFDQKADKVTLLDDYKEFKTDQYSITVKAHMQPLWTLAFAVCGVGFAILGHTYYCSARFHRKKADRDWPRPVNSRRSMSSKTSGCGRA